MCQMLDLKAGVYHNRVPMPGTCLSAPPPPPMGLDLIIIQGYFAIFPVLLGSVCTSVNQALYPGTLSAGLEWSAMLVRSDKHYTVPNIYTDKMLRIINYP